MARLSRYTREGRRQASRAADAVAKLSVNSAVPTITGTTTEGQTLTAVAGTWSNTPTLSYQWRRSGSAIVGGTAGTYVLTADDVGETISVTEIAVNDGVRSTATSAETAEIAAA